MTDRSLELATGDAVPAIAAWVAAQFKTLTVGGETVYGLTQPISDRT